MRHLKTGRKLNRNATHRLALMRNLTRALVLSESGRIITTVEKAKEARRFIERMITFARRNTLHARRLALAKLPDKEVIHKLFTEIGPRFKDRPGGYTRIIKRHERRLGDGGKTAYLELLKEGEVKIRARAPAEPQAPAPMVAPPTPAASTPPATPPAPEGATPATPPSPETPAAS